MSIRRLFAHMAAAALLAIHTTAGAQVGRSDADAEFNDARAFWDKGEYPAALRGFQRILSSPTGEKFFERIALMTGELYRTTELTTDGRTVKISPTGRWVAYERGAAPNVWTVIVSAENLQPRDSLAGTNVAFDDARGRVAVLRNARLVIRDLASHAERVFGDSTYAVASPQFAPDGTLLFIGRRQGESATHVWSLNAELTATREPTATRLTNGDAARSDLQILPGGRAALFLIGRDPFAAAGGGAGGAGGAGGGGRGAGRGGAGVGEAAPTRGAAGAFAPAGAGGGRGGTTREFVIRDLSNGAERAFNGSSPSFSSDGGTLAYLERRGNENLINVVKLAAREEPLTVLRSTEGMDAPAISPDGKTIALQFMAREDWEISLVDADGKNPRRLTHDIGHDVLPRWLTASTLVSAMGEPRHRRSFLYDIANPRTRTRVFHNNTIRTVSPEYEWAVSPDGSKIAIVAERDGNTVSPERGVYVTDLRTKVTRDELTRRVASQLADEVALRAEAKRRFGPVDAEIRPVTQAVSKDRIYWYAHDLFDFDSKHVTQPGNAKAIVYLDSVYRSFGYEPQLQWFDPRQGNRTANVVATLKGTVSPEVVYVVGSHFDSRAEGPGADDDASSTTMLLETARVLARHPLPATVVFVSYTGEEAGLLGSREFVRRVKDSLKVVGAMNNDMVGFANDQRLDNTIRYSNPGIRDIQHGAALEFSHLITYDALYYKSTDAAALFEQYGDIIGGFGSYPILSSPHYHQFSDVLETINFDQVAENTKANVATMMMLAMAPSRPTGLVAERVGTGVSLTWNPNPEKDIRDYLVKWVDRSGADHVVHTVAPKMSIATIPAGATVTVKAVNAKGLDGWDWARVIVK